jgi:predicted esterase
MVTIQGLPRLFQVDLPSDPSQPMALLFSWHGWMALPTDFQNQMHFDPNAFPMPIMVVTPWDLKMIPPIGLDWDITSGDFDIPFFEGMVKCITEQFNIDQNRIYSYGFSAGAVFTNLLSAKYPNLFAATMSESGVWFNDQNEWSSVSVPIMPWKWPAFDPADRGNVLLTHGGPNDQVAPIVNLEQANLAALPFLFNAGRTVTECWHDLGHAVDPDVNLYEWMWAHTLGGPPIGGIPGDFPQGNCIYHPGP